MYNELDHIEFLYGSVAEYYRTTYEENEGHEPSDEETYKSCQDYFIYKEKCKALDGIPSDFAVAFKKEREANTPKENYYKNYRDYTIAQNSYINSCFIDMIKQFSNYYNVQFLDVITDDMLISKTFRIRLEYTDHCEIKSKYLINLNYEQFKIYFRDLYYMQYNPVMYYDNRTSGNHIIRTFTSLGTLRIHVLQTLGFETDETISKDLEEAGFDENQLKERFNKDYRP